MPLLRRSIPNLLSDSLVIRPSRELRENPPSLEILPLLSPDILLLPVPSLLLRSGLPVEVGIENFLSLIELSERKDLLEMIRLLELLFCGRVTLEPDSLVPTLPPMREDLFEFIRLLEFSSRGRVTRELDPPELILLPMREDMLEFIRLLELSPRGCVTRKLDPPELTLLPMREDMLESIRLLVLSVLTCELRVLGIIVLIKLPIRDDLLELIRLLELPICGCVLGVLGVLVLIKLPIREDLLELIRLLELPVCGCALRVLCVLGVLGVLMLIELPIREDLLELIRLFELVDVGDLLMRELLDGPRVLEEIPDRMVTGWLTVVRLDRLLVLPLLGIWTFTLLIVPLEEILRGEMLRIELLRDEILLRLEDLGVIVLVGALLTDRDEVVDLDDIDRLDED